MRKKLTFLRKTLSSIIFDFLWIFTLSSYQFFKYGDQLNDTALPDWMITQDMKQAMQTISTFSEKDRQYFQYQARQEYLREQRSIQIELEQAKREVELANAEIARLNALHPANSN